MAVTAELRFYTRTARGPTGRWLGPALVIAAVAALLRVVSGVYFANYDTLYALVWGQQLSRGQTPQYGIPVAPTPHPLIEALGLVLSPLGPRAVEDVIVALAYLALAGCGWVLYRLGSEWFGRGAGALAALILLTRVPVLSYGTRAYVDVPYLLLVLGALLVETRRRRAGAPVLALLALAGLLRPEAWVFSGLYWLYLAWSRTHTRAQLARLALLGAAAPILWVGSDALVTGHPLWSLTNTRHTARTLDRVTGIANVPQYIPRRVGEILRPPVLAGAALGGVLSLAWLRDRARIGAISGVVAVVVFVVFATAGLPINTRYAFLVAAILAVFCGAGVFGWTLLEREDPHRRWWMAGAAVVAVALVAYTPSQISGVHSQLWSLERQQTIQNDLVALVADRTIALGCGPVGVPNHAPVPLLALRLQTSPANIADLADERRALQRGSYVAAATREVTRDYVLDLNDPHVRAPHVPPGFALIGGDRSWRVYRRC